MKIVFEWMLGESLSSSVLCVLLATLLFLIVFETLNLLIFQGLLKRLDLLELLVDAIKVSLQLLSVKG